MCHDTNIPRAMIDYRIERASVFRKRGKPKKAAVYLRKNNISKENIPKIHPRLREAMNL